MYCGFIYYIHLYTSLFRIHLHMFLYLGYEAEEELSYIIKEKVSEEVLSHKLITGTRKLVLLSL